MERERFTAGTDSTNTIITTTNDDNTTITTTTIINTTTTNVDRKIRLPLLLFSSSSLSLVSPKTPTIYFSFGVSQLFQERITDCTAHVSNNLEIKLLPSFSVCASGLIHRTKFTIPYLFSASPFFPERSIPSYTTQFYNISKNVEGFRNIGFVWFGGVQVAVPQQPQAIVPPQPVLPPLPVLPPPPVVLHEIRVMVIGAKSTGKSTFLGCFQSEREGNVWRVDFPIRDGLIRFVCLETLERDLYINSQTNSFQTDGIILLVDALNASTCKLACDLYHKAFLSIGSDTSKPIVIACNKSETHPKKHVNSRPTIDVGVKIPSYYISAKNHVDIRKPFLGIAKAIGLKLGVLAQWDLDSDAG
ncbi:hypothetical protein MKX03_014282 [Papaver bracteatum]|nr:hypothetical protein MKX03_014282 [Papaver bracteatum]